MKYDKIMMSTAYIWSNQSYCKRRKVGAVLSKDGRILATGYNGTISGLPNDCEESFVICPDCSKKISLSTIRNNDSLTQNNKYLHICECGTTLEYDENYLNSIPAITSDFTLHAEQNIITFCAKNGIPTDNTTLYITTSPCRHCAKLIAQAGIKRVVYGEAYKDTSGIEFLEKIGIEIVKYN